MPGINGQGSYVTWIHVTAASFRSSFSSGSNINAYDAIGKILDHINLETEVNYVYFNNLTLLNEQIYLIDSISIFQMAKLELLLDKEKAREVNSYQFFKVIQWSSGGQSSYEILISKIFRLNGVGKIWSCQPRTLVLFILHQI